MSEKDRLGEFPPSTFLESSELKSDERVQIRDEENAEKYQFNIEIKADIVNTIEMLEKRK